MSAELAIERLRKMQRKLSPDETGPELAYLLAVMEGARQADAEMRAAAEGAQPPAEGYWGMDGADRNPELFKTSAEYGRCTALQLTVPPGKAVPNLAAAQLSPSPQTCRAWCTCSVLWCPARAYHLRLESCRA